MAEINAVRHGGESILIADSSAGSKTVTLPAGSYGHGRYRGKSSFDAFAYQQSVVESSTRFDPPFRYQPPLLSLSRFKKVLPWFLRG